MILFNKSLKIAKKIKKEIILIFKYKIKDPRLTNINISFININNDLKYIDIYFFKNFNFIKNFKKISGFLKYQLSCRLKISYIPELRFFYDNSII
ncbi:Ribosome-binding factor A [Candidatus Johnevansia muelleri]|uniref:Ribosome-binding factor A n=1 Tax=Candidatus Johnevansia muelleri TaxID=1495769 RepID=A0A078KID2_9GAMM|nr:Ribosome-binding factor A [Candidatus Evansia muelleri]